MYIYSQRGPWPGRHIMIDIDITSKDDMKELYDFLIDNRIMTSVIKNARERKAERKNRKDTLLSELRDKYDSLLESPTELESDLLLKLRSGWLLTRRCLDRKHVPYKWLVVDPATGRYCSVTHQPVKSRNVRWRVANGCCIERKDVSPEDIEFAFDCGDTIYKGGRL